MKIISGEWITNGRTVYTKVTDTRSRHPGGQQAILSIAEGWSDRESAMFCQRIVAVNDMLSALEDALHDITGHPSGYISRTTGEKIIAALAKAKGADHAATPTD